MGNESAIDYIDQLIADCHAAKDNQFTPDFEIQDFSRMKDLSRFDKIKNAIYIIEQVGGDIQETWGAFDEYRGTQKELKENKEDYRACAKLNKEPRRVMYVGSKTTDLKSRMKQHIGVGSKGTYALHLKHWFEGECKITVKAYDVSPSVLQIIEDALSFELKPAFGKQGGNNK